MRTIFISSICLYIYTNFVMLDHKLYNMYLVNYTKIYIPCSILQPVLVSGLGAGKSQPWHTLSLQKQTWPDQQVHQQQNLDHLPRLLSEQSPSPGYEHTCLFKNTYLVNFRQSPDMACIKFVFTMLIYNHFINISFFKILVI